MTKRKWIKGDNGMWSSLDLGCLREMGKRRAEAVRDRLTSLIARDKWQRRGGKWARSIHWAKRDAEKSVRLARASND